MFAVRVKWDDTWRTECLAGSTCSKGWTRIASKHAVRLVWETLFLPQNESRAFLARPKVWWQSCLWEEGRNLSRSAAESVYSFCDGQLQLAKQKGLAAPPHLRGRCPLGENSVSLCLHWARFDQTRSHEALGDISQTKTDLLASSSSLLQCPLRWKLRVGDVYMTVHLSHWIVTTSKRGCDCAERFCLKPHLTQNQRGYFLPRFLSVCFLVLFIECFNIKRFFLEYWSSGCVWEPCPFHRCFASAQIQRAIC